MKTGQTILVTGAAGFIGYHTIRALLHRGDRVIGIDNLNSYYDPRLKQARLDALSDTADQDQFTPLIMDLANTHALTDVFRSHGTIQYVIHLAAQAGVRHARSAPWDYIRSNIDGHLSVLEACRHTEHYPRLVYASSSSVYGAGPQHPSAVDQRTDSPRSLYAATKKAGELMSQTYAHLYGIPQVGLRFFTVYGPWGRPDMALFQFVRAALTDQTIDVFNGGQSLRDFTYINDIVPGILSALEAPDLSHLDVPHKIYNLGHNEPEKVLNMIQMIEQTLRVQIKKNWLPLPAHDVPATWADITKSTQDLGYQPVTPISKGIPAFIKWYKNYYGIS